jgi:hypothetical protein
MAGNEALLGGSPQRRPGGDPLPGQAAAYSLTPGKGG